MLIPITTGKTWDCNLQKFRFGDTKLLDNVCLVFCLFALISLWLFDLPHHFDTKFYSVFKP